MNRNRPDLEYIRRYHNGELSPREMYELERQAQDDPMLMDIIMGIELSDEETVRKDLSDIKSRITERISDSKIKQMPVWRKWVVAASVLLLLSIGALVMINQQPANKEIASTTLSEPSILITPDSGDDADVTDKTSKQASPTPSATQTDRLASVITKKNNPTEDIATQAEQSDIRDEKSSLAALQQKSSGVRVHISESLAKDSTLVLSGLSEDKIAFNSPKEELSTALAGKAAGVRIRGVASNGIVNNVISGQVLDKSTNLPLEGAILKIKNTDLTAVTDSAGQFQLLSSGSNPQVEVQAIGYETQQVSSNQLANNQVKLSPAHARLEEVVVTDYASKKKSVKLITGPEGGWKAFENYIKKEIRRTGTSAKGKVELSFIIDPNGKPSHIQVISGIDNVTDQQAVRMLENGPKWKTGEDQQKNSITYVTINFSGE
ncbi:carboxypeptidase-like regulatory domain-containing protein [Sphingobacterium spiritivorum]|uniref:carboxypeptidase-like regulatory domain-containing protein n=1 Tax=Sphingobacterium spiritivorum TaxID=258 RepID=UPI003DA3F315